MEAQERTPSSVYNLKKEELQRELKDRGLDYSGTVEELRKRLSQALKEKKTAHSARSEEQQTGSDTDSDSPEDHEDQPTGSATDIDLDEDPENQLEMETSKSQAKPEPPATIEQVTINTPRLSDGDVMDKVRKWNVKYDKGQDPLAFLERVEELATCYEIPVQRVYRALPELLTRNALAWYRNNRDNWSGWNDFVRDFKDFFLPPRYHIKLSDEIRARFQREGEKAKDFITEIQSLMRWASNMSGEEKLERIYGNLRPEYRFYIRRSDFTDLSSLVKMAEEFEVLKADEARNLPQRNKPDRQINIEKNRALPIAPTYSRSECCWRCGQRGHRRFQCRNQPVIFCSRCGKENVRSQVCPCPRMSPRDRNFISSTKPGNDPRGSANQGSRSPMTQP